MYKFAIGLGLGTSIGLSISAINLLITPIESRLVKDIENKIIAQETILQEQNRALQKCNSVILANNAKFERYIKATADEISFMNDAKYKLHIQAMELADKNAIITILRNEIKSRPIYEPKHKSSN